MTGVGWGSIPDPDRRLHYNAKFRPPPRVGDEYLNLRG